MDLAQKMITEVNYTAHYTKAYSAMQRGKDIHVKVKVRKERPRVDGTAAIMLQCFVQKQKVVITTNLYVEPRQFNDKKERVRASHPQAVDYNLMIEDLLSRIHEIRVQYRLGELKLNPEIFKDLVLESSINTDFLAYFNWKLKQRKSQVSEATYKHNLAVYRRLKEWRQAIPFSQISEKLFFDYRRWLLRENSLNTVTQRMKTIKTYLNLAKLDGFKFEMPHDSLKRIVVPTRIDVLNRQQLRTGMNLYKNNYLDEAIHQTLRCFLFSCFTGLRYSDIAQLSQDMIFKDHIILTPAKTRHTNGRIVKIPLSTPAKSLLSKDADKPLGQVISNQKMNKNLKRIAAFLGTDFNLTFHISRHTFATIFLELGGSVEVLQTLLGHSSIKQTMVYTHVVDQRREDQINNFNRLL